MKLFIGVCAVVALAVGVRANEDIHGEIIDYVAKVGEKAGLSKDHQTIVIQVLHDKIPNDSKKYADMNEEERAEVHKKWEEAKTDIEAKLGDEDKSDWEKFVKVFEKKTDDIDHGKPADRRRRSLFGARN